jgi:integrase
VKSTVRKVAASKKRTTVESVMKKGDGRYSFGQSLYLVKRGNSTLWEYQYRDGPIRRSAWLGSATGPAPVTLTDARAERQRLWLERRKRRANGITPATQQTFEEAANAFLAIKGTQWKNAAVETRKAAGMLKNYCSAFYSKPVSRVTVTDVLRTLQPIWTKAGHSQGSKLRGILEGIFFRAKVPNNPARLDVLRQEGLEDRDVDSQSYPSLPYTDAPDYFATLAADHSEQARAIRFMILAGTRPNEALEADWSEFNIAKREFVIPAARMKMNEAHIVPLNDAMLAVLGEPKPSGPVFGVGYAAVWKHVKASGLKDPKQDRVITPHGFRSTLSTWAQDNGFDEKLIDLTIAHKERSKVRRAYLRSERLPERRALLERYAAYVTGACK